MDEVEFSHKLPNGDRVHVIASGNVYAAEYYQPAHVTMLNIDVYTSDDSDGVQLFRNTIGDHEWERIEDKAVDKLCGLVEPWRNGA